MRPSSQLALATLAVALVARAGGAGEKRFQLAAGGGVALGTVGWTARSGWEQHAETATLQADHEAGAGPALEASLGVRLSSRLGLRAALVWVHRDTEARVVARVPHPFFFDRPRELQTRVPGLEYREWSGHLDLEWRPVVGRTELGLFVGVCLVRAETDIVDRVEIDEEYPYDEIAFRSAVVRRARSGAGVGWSAGTAVSHAVSDRLALALQARYTRATVELPDPEPTSLAAGGLRLTAFLGLRF